MLHTTESQIVMRDGVTDKVPTYICLALHRYHQQSPLSTVGRSLLKA